MQFFKKYKYPLLGAVYILIGNLFTQNNWRFTIFNALLFAVLGIILPPLITFMSDKISTRR